MAAEQVGLCIPPNPPLSFKILRCTILKHVKDVKVALAKENYIYNFWWGKDGDSASTFTAMAISSIAFFNYYHITQRKGSRTAIKPT